MKLGKGRGTEVCYNVQTAVDSKHKLIVANDVTNDTHDRDWLSPMALQAQDILGSPFVAGADVGYYHGEEVKTCLEAGITPYVARPVTSATRESPSRGRPRASGGVGWFWTGMLASARAASGGGLLSRPLCNLASLEARPWPPVLPVPPAAR